MNKLQQEIHEWQMETFKSADQVSKYYHLIKEIDELRAALIENDIDSITGEIADCCFLLFGIASLYEIDVQKAMEKKLVINKNRKWGKPDKNGVVEHIKDSPDE
jgi:NTP pyrophosphatase (non-canonical NTP hydrolase)